MYYPAMGSPSQPEIASSALSDPAGQPLLLARDLVKQYGERRVVDGVSLTLAYGAAAD